MRINCFVIESIYLIAFAHCPIKKRNKTEYLRCFAILCSLAKNSAKVYLPVHSKQPLSLAKQVLSITVVWQVPSLFLIFVVFSEVMDQVHEVNDAICDITRIVQTVSNMTHCVSCFPTLLYLAMEMVHLKCYILGICFIHSMNRDRLVCHSDDHVYFIV
jgi:hypothetical protein